MHPDRVDGQGDLDNGSKTTYKMDYDFDAAANAIINPRDGTNFGDFQKVLLHDAYTYPYHYTLHAPHTCTYARV